MFQHLDVLPLSWSLRSGSTFALFLPPVLVVAFGPSFPAMAREQFSGVLSQVSLVYCHSSRVPPVLLHLGSVVGPPTPN